VLTCSDCTSVSCLAMESRLVVGVVTEDSLFSDIPSQVSIILSSAWNTSARRVTSRSCDDLPAAPSRTNLYTQDTTKRYRILLHITKYYYPVHTACSCGDVHTGLHPLPTLRIGPLPIQLWDLEIALSFPSRFCGRALAANIFQSIYAPSKLHLATTNLVLFFCF